MPTDLLDIATLPLADLIAEDGTGDHLSPMLAAVMRRLFDPDERERNLTVSAFGSAL